MTEISKVLKVIGFDSWTGGSANFERLVDAFRNAGMELSLVHIGSWGGDPGRPKAEKLGKIDARDISFYGTNKLADILDREKPSAVVFLSTDTFAHRAFNRLCRLRNIPTLHLYHGLVSVQDVGSRPAYKVNIFAQVRFVLERIPKALKHIWPSYASSMFATKASISEWLRFAEDILKGAVGKFNFKSADDARTDVCCVYVAADVGHATAKYGFNPADVMPVGNPDLIRFGLTSEMIGVHLQPNAAPEFYSDVMYVDTGLVYTGFVFQSQDDFIQHLNETKDRLALQGKRLLFKPHPDHYRSGILSRLQEAGIQICANDELVRRLQTCCACIVEPSSLSLVPALMGLPLLLAQYGKLSQQRFGKVLTSYPRAAALTDLDGFNELLESERITLDVAKTLQWIDQNAGPQPADEMPLRVANIMKHMVLRSSIQLQPDGHMPGLASIDANRQTK